MELHRVFSGIQPTGECHIGNYFGAIKNWVALQDKYECFYCIVDYHAITVDFDPKRLHKRVIDMAGDLIACGIDPKKSILFVQSHIPEHTELSWIFNCFTSYGDLTRMTQFKAKSEEREFVSAGLFNYPVLQAADILLYKADRVPVGEDQLQHLELCRRIARRFNSKFGVSFFPEVQPILSKAPKIMSLADPLREMSKSAEDKHSIGIMEDENSIYKKIKSAVTDIGLQPGQEMTPGVKNLFLILEVSAEPEVVESLKEKHREGKLLYKDLKEIVYENLIQEIKPIRERRREIKEEEIERELKIGAEKASVIAKETMKEMRRIIGVGI